MKKKILEFNYFKEINSDHFCLRNRILWDLEEIKDWEKKYFQRCWDECGHGHKQTQAGQDGQGLSAPWHCWLSPRSCGMLEGAALTCGTAGAATGAAGWSRAPAQPWPQTSRAGTGGDTAGTSPAPWATHSLGKDTAVTPHTAPRSPSMGFLVSPLRHSTSFPENPVIPQWNCCMVLCHC